MTTRQALLVALAAGSVALTAACTSASEANGGDDATGEQVSADDLVLAYLPKRMDQGYFQSEAAGVEAKSAELGVETLILDARFDANTMSSQLDTAINQGAKGVILITVDQQMGPSLMTRAEQAGVTVLALDDPIEDASGQPVPFLGYDFEQIGADVGAQLATLATERGWPVADLRVAALTFDEVTSCTTRTDATKQALLDGLDGLQEQQILETNYAGANTDGALQAMQGLLTSNPGVQHWLVYSCNEEGVVGAVRALEAAGVDATSCGVGIGDGALAGIEMLKPEENAYCGNLFIDGEANGALAVQQLYDALVNGEELPAQTLSPGVVVTRENAAEVFGG
ncbi:substrate-binding domain-containing protein [Jiangella asiatica]|uniref:Periplasmic binding protein domain-containing protein n=1 Tax=Jiangella asiatica TaxID=2530372 RepID=A0A4R5DGM5_9ACTN|nr:substrate-binding domain-containing protein [Jiangella asiatica]TDE09865.1 hypothetical protein E1269_12870 [Jiangella asiatica]